MRRKVLQVAAQVPGVASIQMQPRSMGTITMGTTRFVKNSINLKGKYCSKILVNVKKKKTGLHRIGKAFKNYKLSRLQCSK